VEIMLLNGTGELGKDVNAEASCYLGTRSYLESLRLYPGGDIFSKGFYLNDLVAGDAMSASLSRANLTWTFTLVDHTAGWTMDRDMPADPLTYTTAEIHIRNGGGNENGPVAFTGTTVNGQPLADLDPVAVDSTLPNGEVDHTGPLSGGDFTVALTGP
jgi:hypothetical protein